jgi:hypothetical protein
MKRRLQTGETPGFDRKRVSKRDRSLEEDCGRISAAFPVAQHVADYQSARSLSRHYCRGAFARIGEKLTQS